MTKWPISKLHNWQDNPRAVKKEDFERLKQQIQDLGLYKPFLVEPDGNTLGGNMRLRACLELGIEDVPVSIITPKNDAERLKYALSDNDRVGYYVDDQLAELIAKYQDEIDLTQYKVDLGQPIDLKSLLDQYQPVEEDEAPPLPEGEPISKLGEVYELGRWIICPKCSKKHHLT